MGVTYLAWGMLEFKNGYLYSEEYQNMLDQLSWPLDYLAKCVRSDKEIIAQVGDGKQDHAQWVSTTYWDNKKRKTFKINKGTDLGAEMAAALASSYLVYKNVNPDFAEKLLVKSKLAFKFAERTKTH